MANLHTLSAAVIYAGAATLVLTGTGFALRRRASTRQTRERVGELRCRLTQLDSRSTWRSIRQHMGHWQSVPWSFESLDEKQRGLYLRLARAIEHVALKEGAAPGPVLPRRDTVSTETRRAAEQYRGGLFETIPTLADAERCAFLSVLLNELLDSLNDPELPPSTGHWSAAYDNLDLQLLPPLAFREWKPWYEHLSAQIRREDDLVHQRLT
jgi:hypothetical protein